jgi:ABC-type glycerol-3-phosphate transport system permease component
MPRGRMISQRVLLLGVLTIGAIVFAFPFVNMVSTSIKLDEEMGSEHFTLLPKRPIPRQVSPYAMEETDWEIKRPGDMSRATWASLELPLQMTVKEAVQKWLAGQEQVHEDFASMDRAAAVESLTRVVGAGVLAQISDKARLGGVAAMLAEVPRLASDEKIAEAFNEYVPRMCVGDVRVRLSDYSQRAVGTGDDWRVSGGHAALARLRSPLVNTGQVARLMKYDTRDGTPVGVTMGLKDAASAAATQSTALPPLRAEDAARVDRVYVAYQADQSWSRLELTVTAQGRVYRLSEPLYAAERKWVELEVRIPGKEEVPLSGRTFFLLRDEGAAREGARPFEVTLTVAPNSAVGSWWAKVSRNYYAAFRQVPIARYIGTSVALAILSIVLTVFGSSLSAYAFARIEFPGRNILFAMLLATMMIPGQVTMIPGFLINKSLGWYNTLYPLWVPAMFGSAFFVFMMRQFFMSIPKELEDAARIDGCGFLGIYWHVMLPLIRPTLVTVAIFAFMGSWNNFMGPLIYVNDERLYNLAFGLFKFQLQSGQSSSLMMAGAFVMTLPIIAIFFLFQRYFVQGISLSGLGGR